MASTSSSGTYRYSTPERDRNGLTVGVSDTIDAPASLVYRLIADYRDGHPRIVPPKYFRNLRVIEGGYGAGTIIEFEMLAMGSTQHARSEITEPDPGRVLVETELKSGAVTTFTVAPLGDGACRLTISTEMPVRAGIVGKLQRWMFSSYLRRVYQAEFHQVRRVAVEERA